MKDLIILGNGMAGMTAALYAKRAGLNFKLIGRDEYDFGQIGSAVLVENYPCAASQKGFDLAMNLHNQLVDNNIEINEYEVYSIWLEGSHYFIECDDKSIHETKSIIYALGASPRKLNCEIAPEVPIHYCAICDGPLYKDKKVAVIGGGDSAFTQAEYLSKICKQVLIIMCDENITASPATVERVKEINNIKIQMNYPVSSITKNNDSLYCLWSRGIRGFYCVDGIFVAIGMKPNTVPLKFFDLLRNQDGYVLADENGKTAYKGLFAAGDVRYKKLRQSITAAADGANAVQSVIEYLKEN